MESIKDSEKLVKTVYLSPDLDSKIFSICVETSVPMAIYFCVPKVEEPVISVEKVK